MLDKVLIAFAVAAFSTGAAYAGTCSTSERTADSRRVDVNIKVKNDTNESILVSIWKGTETVKQTVFADEVAVVSDGKTGKTDKNVKAASFYFSARKTNRDLEARCGFYASTSTTPGAIGSTKNYFANIEDFNCAESGDFKISCEKAFDKNKYRWNVTYSLE